MPFLIADHGFYCSFTLLFKDSIHFVKGIGALAEDGPRKHGGSVNDLVSGLGNGNSQQLNRFIQQEFWGTGNFPVYLNNLSQGKLGKFSELSIVGGKGAVAISKAAYASVTAIQSAGSVSTAFKLKLTSIKSAIIVNKVWIAKASTATIIKAGGTLLFKAALSAGKLAIAVTILAVIIMAVGFFVEMQEREKKRDLCKIEETKTEKAVKKIGSNWQTAVESGALGGSGGAGDTCSIS